LQDSAQNIVIRQLPPSQERLPLLIVGDIHGCASELHMLLRLAKERAGPFLPVFVGDLFTKGPDPVGVLELIHEYGALCIKGNHDWALSAAIQAAQKRGIKSLPEHTQQTLHLIRFHKRAVMELLHHLPHAYCSTVHAKRPGKDWEEEYPLIIVHAGIDCTQGLEKTSERMLLTVRYVRWDDAHPGEKRIQLVPSGYRAEVMGSMAPTSVIAATSVLKDPRTTKEIIASPRTDRFRWHELHQGPELIVFGHDAKQGLFRKTLLNHRPICIGVDTGCTYGRSLTGYFPEFDDAIQVPARRTYFDIARNIILMKPSTARVAV
jgi:hypothetical protein